MGQTLELYQLDWTQLTGTLGSGNTALVKEIESSLDHRMFTAADAEIQKLLWRKAVEALVTGRRGEEIRQRATHEPDYREEVTDLAALAMLGIIRSQGVPVATLEHNSKAGDAFREEFLAALPAALGLAVEPELIVNRPLSGLTHATYPSWGGLSKSEIAQVFNRVSMDDLPTLDDSDLDGWLYDFINGLEAVYEAKSDLVTLYL